MVSTVCSSFKFNYDQVSFIFKTFYNCIATEFISPMLFGNSQIVVDYLSGFFCDFKTCFKISFKVLKKFSIDETLDKIVVAYLVVTARKERILNSINLKQLLFF